MKSKFAVISIAFLGIVGCAGQPTLEEAQAELCTNIATLRQSMASLTALSQNSTVGQLKEAQAAVADSFKAVKESAAQVQDVRVDDLEQSFNNLDRAVKDVSDSDTISDAVSSIQPSLNEVQAAQDELYSGAACN